MLGVIPLFRSPLNISRKHATYKIASLLIRTYMGLNSPVKMCVNILVAMRTAEMPADTEYPLGHRCELCYWKGVIAVVNEKYEEVLCFVTPPIRVYFLQAEMEFEKALDMLPASYCIPVSDMRVMIANRRRMLHYLIPVKLILRNQMPSKELQELFDCSPLANGSNETPIERSASSLFHSVYGSVLRKIRSGRILSANEEFSEDTPFHVISHRKMRTMIVWERAIWLAGWRRVVRLA